MSSGKNHESLNFEQRIDLNILVFKHIILAMNLWCNYTCKFFKIREIIIPKGVSTPPKFTFEFVSQVMRECNGLLSEVWINTVQHSSKLNCNTFLAPNTVIIP